MTAWGISVEALTPVEGCRLPVELDADADVLEAESLEVADFVELALEFVVVFAFVPGIVAALTTAKTPTPAAEAKAAA